MCGKEIHCCMVASRLPPVNRQAWAMARTFSFGGLSYFLSSFDFCEQDQQKRMGFMEKHTPLAPLQLWGGLECTVNRVRDDYFSQVERNGHHERDSDIARFASLGIRAI